MPTFTILRRVVALGEQQPCPLPAYMPQKARMLVAQQSVSFPKALAAGVKIVMGTDGGAFGHGKNAGELAYMVAAGMTPMQAIVASTQMGALCMGIGTDVGILRADMLADLLVVDGDPLEDVCILKDRVRLRLIMKDGVVIKNTVPVSTTPVPPPYSTITA